jgi:ribonuclease HI
MGTEPDNPADQPADGSSSSAAVAVYTDGACSGNPGPGGWAWATTDGRQGSGGDEMTTNQRMELQAVLEALRAIDEPVVVHSDSTYVVNCFNDGWYQGWLARGWKTSGRKPVANRDLWEPLIELYLDRPDTIEFVWVKGHAGDEMNELVDALAVAESQALRDAASGSTAAEGTAAGSTAAEGTAAGSTAAEGTAGSEAGVGPAVPWPIDRAVAVTGNRDVEDDTLAALESAVDGLDPKRNILVSGLRRGPELVAAERAIRRSIPLGVVLPFADPAARWPGADRRRFDAAIGRAEWVVTLDGDRSKPGVAVEARDRWLQAAVIGYIVVDDEALGARLDAAGLSIIAVSPP